MVGCVQTELNMMFAPHTWAQIHATIPTMELIQLHHQTLALELGV
jgi:hypothetical protein